MSSATCHPLQPPKLPALPELIYKLLNRPWGVTGLRPPRPRALCTFAAALGLGSVGHLLVAMLALCLGLKRGWLLCTCSAVRYTAHYITKQAEHPCTPHLLSHLHMTVIMKQMTGITTYLCHTSLPDLCLGCDQACTHVNPSD